MTGKLILLLISFRFNVEGALQLRAESEPTLAGFQLVCELLSGTITGAVAFYNPKGSNIGSCSILHICSSAVSNTVTQNLSISSTFITIVDANIEDESSVKGDWQCRYSGETATLEVTHLLCNSSLEITKPVNKEYVKTGDQVEFTHHCVCPNATYIVEYVPENYLNETGVSLSIPESVKELTYGEALPSCRNNGSQTITGKFIVGNNIPSKTSRIKVTAQIVGALTSHRPTAVSDFKVEGASKLVPCSCTVTKILGGVLGIPFTILFDAVFVVVVIFFAKDKEIIAKCKEKIILTIVAVIIGVALSCGLGAGVTSAVMSGKDTGNESTGCKCLEYLGVVISLGFSVLGSCVTSGIIYVFVLARKGDGSDCAGSIFGECFNKLQKTCTCAVNPETKRGVPEGTEDNSLHMKEKAPDTTEKTVTIPEAGKPMTTPRDLPPIQKSESALDTMPPRQLPLPPINHQTVK